MLTRTLILAALCAGPPCLPSDFDGDGIRDWADNCPRNHNVKQLDLDKDTPPPVADAGILPGALGGIAGPVRVYPYTPLQTNYPNESTDWPETVGGDDCDIDDDGDGVFERRVQGKAKDNCKRIANPKQEDRDGDGSGDACDPIDDSIRPPATPKITVRAPSTVRAGAISAGMPVTVSCSEACAVRAELRRGARIIGKGAGRLSAAGRTYVFVRIDAATLRRLPRSGVRAELRVLRVGAATPVATRRVRLRS